MREQVSQRHCAVRSKLLCWRVARVLNWVGNQISTQTKNSKFLCFQKIRHDSSELQTLKINLNKPKLRTKDFDNDSPLHCLSSTCVLPTWSPSHCQFHLPLQIQLHLPSHLNWSHTVFYLNCVWLLITKPCPICHSKYFTCAIWFKTITPGRYSDVPIF